MFLRDSEVTMCNKCDRMVAGGEKMMPQSTEHSCCCIHTCIGSLHDHQHPISTSHSYQLIYCIWNSSWLTW